LGYIGARWEDAVAIPSDQYWYQNLAKMIVSGRGISSPTAWAVRHVITPTALHGPLTSFLLVPFDLVGYSTFHEHELIMAVLGTATVLLLAVLAGRLVGHGAGITTAVVGALYPGQWGFDAKVMSEPVEQFLVAVMLVLGFSFRYGPSAKKAVGLGFVVGLLVLTRDEQLLAIPLIVVPLCFGALRDKGRAQALKMIGLSIGTTALVLGPWIGYCETAFHDPEVLSTDLGVGLIQDNNPVTYYSARIGYWWAQAEPSHYPGDESQADRAYQHDAISYARAHASRMPVVILARVGRLWDLYNPIQTANFTAPRPACYPGISPCRVDPVEDLGTQEAWIFSFYVLIPFAIVGIVVLRRRKKILYPLLCLAVIVTVVAIIEAGVLRFRASFEDAFVVLVGVGMYAAVEAGYRRLGAGSNSGHIRAR
jgi:hypothetical protein